jgi:hypothetical protein
MQKASHDKAESVQNKNIASARTTSKKGKPARSGINASPRITEQETLQRKIFGPAMRQKIPDADKGKKQPPAPALINRTGLPDEVKTNMETGFNTDFSDVRIHLNSQDALKINAMAYTQGHDIHFAPGRFNLGTSEGQQILGHELAHVVQQQKGRVKPTGAVAGMPVNDSPELEKEADIAGLKASGEKKRKTSQTTQLKSLESAGELTGGVVQRRVVWQKNPFGIITHISITGRRPSWWAIAKKRHPSQSGDDRRHVMAWTVIKRIIEAAILGKDDSGIASFLLNPMNFNDAAWAASDVMPRVKELLSRGQLADAIEYYARARFNDPGNLFMGPSQPNRALGVRILPAFRALADILGQWNSKIGLDSPLPRPYILKYPFWDSRTRKAEIGQIPINTWADVVNWYANMAMDWDSFDDWENATPAFLGHLESISPELARIMEERAAAKRRDTPQ